MATLRKSKVLADLVGNKVKLPKELPHCDGLWVQCHEDDSLLFAKASTVHQSQCVGKNVQHFGLPSKWLSYQHEPKRKKKNNSTICTILFCFSTHLIEKKKKRFLSNHKTHITVRQSKGGL